MHKLSTLHTSVTVSHNVNIIIIQSKVLIDTEARFAFKGNGPVIQTRVVRNDCDCCRIWFKERHIDVPATWFKHILFHHTLKID